MIFYQIANKEQSLHNFGMAVHFGQIYLYSFDPKKLFGFLSFLLDVEAKAFQEEKILFDFQEIEFVILPAEKKRLDKTKYFSLSVDNLGELEDFKRNIEFYYYKEMGDKFKMKVNESILEFSDPDGRIWQIRVAPRCQIDTSVMPQLVEL